MAELWWTEEEPQEKSWTQSNISIRTVHSPVRKPQNIRSSCSTWGQFNSPYFSYKPSDSWEIHQILTRTFRTQPKPNIFLSEKNMEQQRMSEKCRRQKQRTAEQRRNWRKQSSRGLNPTEPWMTEKNPIDQIPVEPCRTWTGSFVAEPDVNPQSWSRT